MSTLTFLATSALEAGVPLTAAVALLNFATNPDVIRLLTYGSRPIVNASVPHDHDQDGGESLLPAILADSFGTYYQNVVAAGIPVGPPVTGSFAASVSDGIVDKSTAKRLKCWCVVIPGGVLGVRCSLVEYHESASLSIAYNVTFRHLSSVNLKRGVAPEECSVDIAYTTSGVAVYRNQEADLEDLSPLGDPTLDRVVECALWLISDVSATEEQRVLDIQVVPIILTSAPRKKNNNDPGYPSLSIQELRPGFGVVSLPFAQKIKGISNGLNVSVWGSSPGLLPSGSPDRRRRYRETITEAHTHEGSLCPTSTPGEIVGKGACLKDSQSFGYVSYLGETLPLVAATPPTMDSLPSQGAPIHKATTPATDWVQVNFRRSIPAGCGRLILRVALHAGYTFAARSYDTSGTLFMSCTVTSVAGGGDIVTQLASGPYRNPIDNRDPDFGFVELQPLDDLAHVTNRSLGRGQVQTGASVTSPLKGWNHGAELTPAELSLLQVNEVLYRIATVKIQLTYPPERPFETYHPTLDYNIKLRFLMRNSSGVLDTQAGLLWVNCYTADGY